MIDILFFGLLLTHTVIVQQCYYFVKNRNHTLCLKFLSLFNNGFFGRVGARISSKRLSTVIGKITFSLAFYIIHKSPFLSPSLNSLGISRTYSYIFDG